MSNPGDLSRERCFNHAQREAVARCPECRRFFCRECVTEHDDRVLCVTCLPVADSGDYTRKRFSILLKIVLFMGSIFFLWFVFYHMGQILLKLPASFHEGTLWKELWQTI